jgi:hypothetical protein
MPHSKVPTRLHSAVHVAREDKLMEASYAILDAPHGQPCIYAEWRTSCLPQVSGLAAINRDWHPRPLTNRWSLRKQGPITHHRPPHAFADLRGIHIEFRKCPAERVAMHAQLRRRLALVAFVMGKNFQDVTLLELPDGVRIRYAGAVHLRDQGVQFALQRLPRLLVKLLVNNR